MNAIDRLVWVRQEGEQHPTPVSGHFSRICFEFLEHAGPGATRRMP
jgi:hypothetical protein